MKAVFLDQKTFVEDIELSCIDKQVSTLSCYDTTQHNEVIERCKNAEIIITNKVVLDSPTLKKLSKLKLICIAATGINNVDIDCAKELGIAVTNVSGYAQGSVAQYVFAQLLEYFSQVHHHNNNVTDGLWQQSPNFCFHGGGSRELAGKTLGIVGYGNLGKTVAKIAQAFGMTVIVAERPDSKTIRDERLPFEQVITTADILSLHCPLTPNTNNLINTEVLNKMKNSAVLINTARGNIVNEQDLLTALNTQQIAYAILDVLSQEPPQENHPLLSKQPHNLKITAHIAWASIEAQQRLINLIALNIRDFKLNKQTNRVEN